MSIFVVINSNISMIYNLDFDFLIKLLDYLTMESLSLTFQI